jgi:uncharacterized membrane protein
MPWLDALIAVAVLALALALRPWRMRPGGVPPWPALAWLTLMPLLWGTDRIAATPLVQPLSGSVLVLLMLGWPLAVLWLLPVAAATLALGLPAEEALHRLVWQGYVPATLALALGAALRRWLPNHLFVYILGRGFFATAVALMAAGTLSVLLHGTPGTLQTEEVLVARWLSSWGDAFLTGMLVAVFVAFRPQWLATYADRIYLPK